VDVYISDAVLIEHEGKGRGWKRGYVAFIKEEERVVLQGGKFIAGGNVVCN